MYPYMNAQSSQPSWWDNQTSVKMATSPPIAVAGRSCVTESLCNVTWAVFFPNLLHCRMHLQYCPERDSCQTVHSGIHQCTLAWNQHNANATDPHSIILEVWKLQKKTEAKTKIHKHPTSTSSPTIQEELIVHSDSLLGHLLWHLKHRDWDSPEKMTDAFESIRRSSAASPTFPLHPQHRNISPIHSVLDSSWNHCWIQTNLPNANKFSPLCRCINEFSHFMMLSFARISSTKS